MAVLILRRRPGFHRLLKRFAYVVIAMALIQFYSLHLSYYEALADKYSPTIFVNLSPSRQESLASLRWQVDVATEQNNLRSRLLNNRAHWKILGSGYEGDTFTFNGSVIKVFRPRRSPLRNCVAEGAPQFLWPPEIPISLLLGGSNNSSSLSPVLSDRPSSFLPVQDYFFLPTADDDKRVGEWHLVTKFLSQGTLEHTAKRLRSQFPPPGADQVDARFRPSLNRLLDALGVMHSEYGLCHDDIKIDNIFVDDSTRADPGDDPSRSGGEGRDANWILGDLGNARQVSHSYHASLLWTHDNGQHPDCRVNDVLRLVRTYAIFLQSATTSSKTNKQAYNEAFLGGSAPWAQLYWHTIRSAWDGATVAHQIRKLSIAAFAPVNDSVSAPIEDEVPQGATSQHVMMADSQLSWFEGWFDSRTKAMAVERELHTGGSVSEKWAKIFGTMGILKTPSRGCGPIAWQSNADSL
ncbi:hypothetical protein N0V82_006545 [Gnomoniopsis sp. IMI 355080]|nr:hypothetical protein N0V82_006545 [Gnomoniopsis sp. IMI 355080]